MTITEWINKILFYGSVQVNSIESANEIVEAAKGMGYNFIILKAPSCYVISK